MKPETKLKSLLNFYWKGGRGMMSSVKLRNLHMKSSMQ